MGEEASFLGAKHKYLFWVFLIKFLSGSLNVYGIKVLGSTVSHHTGNITWIAIKILEEAFPLKLILVVFSFFLGSCISGMIFCNRKNHPKKPYDISLIFGGLVLIALDFLHLEDLEIYIIPFWLGMQNGMFITYKKVLVRTTHITGYLTDAGFALGSYFMGNKLEIWKFKFYLTSILIFILGGLAGYLIIMNLSKPLAIIGLLYLLSGILDAYGLTKNYGI